MKITTKMTVAAYIAAKNVYHGKMTKSYALDNLESDFSMKRGSASDYIVNFKKMIVGDKYTRTNNAEATNYFLTKILEDYGTGKLENALKAANEHVDYYEGLERGNLPGIRKIIEKHENIFKSLISDENPNPFFNSDEIEFFKKWADKVYQKSNADHVSAKNYLLETVWKKTQFWSSEVIKGLEHYETLNHRMWSKPGSKNGKTVSIFKPYSWARIYKKGDRDKGIFFTVGVDPLENAIVYKLDYFYENDSLLTKEQKELCEKHIPIDLRWNEILTNDLSDWDWDRIIRHTVDFIAKNSHHYDQVVSLVFGDSEVEAVFTNNLTLRSSPKGKLTEPPKAKPSFKGVEIDYEKRNKENKELGDYGEKLVIEYEKNKLEEKGLTELADRVQKVKDGKGYDVLSFDKNGNETYIEVKTTAGNESTSFYLSRNEKFFFELNNEKYFIYRLYNYDFEKNYADFFILENAKEDLLFEPTVYKVYLKRKNTQKPYVEWSNEDKIKDSMKTHQDTLDKLADL